MISAPRAALRLLAVPLLAAALAAAPSDTQTSPPGDIPDTQAFVRYTSPGGYSVLVPEGWSRTVRGSTATFGSHYDGERIALRHAGGPKVPSAYVSDSPPDAVTGKSIRLEHQTHVYTKGSREAVLDLWAPQGSDNVDQWKKIAQSFRWR